MFLGSTGTGAVPSSRPAPHGPSRAAEVKDGRRPPRSGLSLTEASTMAPSPERHSVAKRKRQLLTRPLRPQGRRGALRRRYESPLRPWGRRGALRRRYESPLRPWGRRGALRRRYESPLRPWGRRGRVRWGHGRVRLSNRWYNLPGTARGNAPYLPRDNSRSSDPTGPGRIENDTQS